MNDSGAKRKRCVRSWFEHRQWQAFPFQRAAWRAWRQQRSGLLHADTGTGKTLAMGFGAWQTLTPTPLCVLWVTPMRALAADAVTTLQTAFDELADLAPASARWQVGLRTGDTAGRECARQDRKPPHLLVTTPESLAVLMARADSAQRFTQLAAVVVDEWHELLGEKRGVLLQLALARLRRWRPMLIVWGMSATLGDLEEARVALLPTAVGDGLVIRGKVPKTMRIETLLPERLERFPWAGHMGLRMLPQVVETLEAAGSALVFTNTRNQAEIWYQALLEARPDWAGLMALHHGSIAPAARAFVERGLKSGSLKLVVCTSSLDLGVDFLPVEQVLQVGSAKGVARLIQRAGRSGHAPGRASQITLVPTHSLEILEAAALRQAVAAGHIESRCSPREPLDVLVQHLVSVGLSGGFRADEMLLEVRTTHAYRHLTDADWQWCLDFIRQGGRALTAYPQFQRCAPDDEGVWRVIDRRIAQRHRMNIGTIASDAEVMVRFGPTPPGQRLGSVEERFVARLKVGERFWFAGRLLEFVRLRDMTCWVRRARGSRASTPRWEGGRMPLSTTLAAALRVQLDAAAHGRWSGREMRAIRPLLELQARVSLIPREHQLLVESLHSREGAWLFVHAFAGRSANLGLAHLFAWRAAAVEKDSIGIAVNDYGFALLSAIGRDWSSVVPIMLGDEDRPVSQEVLASLNAAELARRRFRPIAQIAGLVAGAVPGGRKSARQVQASAGLYFDVFRRHDPGNGLLSQSEREVLADELEIRRLTDALSRLQRSELACKTLTDCSPLAFPLYVERLRERLTNESLVERVRRMTARLEELADA
ncbi:MAG TPA: ligase-associated DNA damage response DEXH box helicase [Steroidobacteraceae bacterium]|jgi:ATP-dependent Lhr-like helicase|nr:ligase-associated DNA damage response DEXH box helicase [Steroidobacteraceae bacterium]